MSKPITTNGVSQVNDTQPENEKASKASLFRLSALLYADNNYELERETVLRKIVESVYLDSDNILMSSLDVVIKCQDRYGIAISVEELNDIVKKYKDRFEIQEIRDDDILVKIK